MAVCGLWSGGLAVGSPGGLAVRRSGGLRSAVSWVVWRSLYWKFCLLALDSEESCSEVMDCSMDDGDDRMESTGQDVVKLWPSSSGGYMFVRFGIGGITCESYGLNDHRNNCCDLFDLWPT